MREEQEMQCRERSVKIPTRTHSSNASNRPTDSALKSFERASMATPQVPRWTPNRNERNTKGLARAAPLEKRRRTAKANANAKETVNSSRDFSTIETREEEETKEFSEITNLQVQTPEIDEIEEAKKKKKKKTQRSEGYLGLLVEAARLISGNFEDGEDRPIQSDRSRAREEYRNRNRNELWRLELCDEGLEDVSPVVRSKRGRNQVLPYRYRDSVLEPLKMLCSSSKQRSSSPRVSAKQRRNRNKLQTRC
ncbi:hypothetical protein Scep_005369 [Stephania cephalantha]|uniref:Uncharacterized protein n=1 Tax=Stephania cephalantha TaxID=152367 RepID=A0AAP0KV27_9MAGN